MRHYTNLGTILIALLMTAQAFIAPVVYLSFKLQQDYIAKNLCERKDAPMTTCYGQCVLRKELKKTAEEERQAKNPVKSSVEVLFCSNILLELPKAIRYITAHSFENGYIPMILSAYTADFFIPPQC